MLRLGQAILLCGSSLGDRHLSLTHDLLDQIEILPQTLNGPDARVELDLVLRALKFALV